MPFSYDYALPTEEELTTNEINVSMAALYAGAFHIGKICENVNNEFMLCRNELQDPRKCINEGKQVTECALNFFQQVKKHCRQEFDQYANCLHKSRANWTYAKCRKTQASFDKCILDKMGIETPPWGLAAEVHIYDAKRPKPEKKKTVFTDVPDKYEPKENPLPPKFNSENLSF